MRWMWRGLALLTLLNVLAGYLWIRAGLPETHGTITVAGLEAPIEIVRDRHAVPHIYAQSESDAYFGLGYVHAQDRLWQMEINRRIAAGRLAELFGKSVRAYDALMRTLSLYHYAERTVPKLDPETRALLDAYGAGVNAFLDARRLSLVPLFLRLPPEFLIFLHSPEPWRPADSLAWLKLMAWDLGQNWRSELLRAMLLRRLTTRQVGEFLPPYPGDQPVALPDPTQHYAKQLLERLWAGGPATESGNGSNAWAVAGGRTVSGKPLLANDPHLRLAAPAVWYLAHLNAPGLDVIGATLPGAPTVIAGRNARIAWGVTNTGPDVQDLYVERLDANDPRKYQTPDGPRPFEFRYEVIRVRAHEDVTIEVRMTRHGPVISDASLRADRYLEPWNASEEKAVLALAWTALRDDDLTLQAGRKIARAGNWAQFVEALRDYHVPQQTIVYADVDGNIGMYAPARVPIRNAENDLHGLLPAPGWKADYDWNGFIPFEELPHRFNPASGMIVAANQKIVPDSYKHHIASEWAPPYRARRIAELLTARAEHSLDSFKRLQGDVRSVMAADFLPLLLRPKPAGRAAAAAREMLMSWDGTMDRERPEPLIFAAWYRELTRLVYADELGPLFREAWGFRPIFMHNALTRQQHWCDDVATEARESCQERIAEALEIAITGLRETHGEDMAAWRWGEAHYARNDHRPFAIVPVLNRLFDIKLPAGGDSYTVNAARHVIADDKAPFAVMHGPSMRAIYDLAQPDRSLFMLSTGQSGNVLSSRYRDFAEPWHDLAYIPMTTDRREIETGALGVLVLVPSGDGGAEQGR